MDGARVKALTYVTVDKAWLYRAVSLAFAAAKERFGLHLRPDEVLAALAERPLPELMNRAQVDAALTQLVEWGNLAAHPDTAEVATVEEFYRPRLLYQLTPAGEAAERALGVYDETLMQPGELQVAALSDIRDLLRELADLAATDPVDAGKAHRTLSALRGRFEELTSRAQTFMGSLQRTIDLQGIDLDAFVAYKDTLIDYLERFIGELVIVTDEIVEAVGDLERRDIDALLQQVAQRDLSDALAPTSADEEQAAQRWQQRWAGLRAWFLRDGGRPSQADVLRARARSAIPALLSAVASINDRRMTRTDRVADLRALARWFAQADSDTDAHRLWRATFGLTSCRHLRVTVETLDAREVDPVPAQTSWLAAPPLRLSPRLRATGRHVRRGPPAGVVDRSAEKALLAAQIRTEAVQTAAARRLLATGRRCRLSELDTLDPTAFGLFLDLLGDALCRKVLAADVVDTVSADGSLAIRLEPTADGVTAVVRTSAGSLTGPDHWLVVTDMMAAPAELAS